MIDVRHWTVKQLYRHEKARRVRVTRAEHMTSRAVFIPPNSNGKPGVQIIQLQCVSPQPCNKFEHMTKLLICA